MKLAIISFEEKSIWTPDSPFIHLKHWWNPPNYVLETWAFGCKIYFENEKDYIQKKQEVLQSREDSIKEFWKLMVF